MANLAPITHFLHPNEKVFALEEAVMTPLVAEKKHGYKPENYQGKHRYQIIGVNRGGRLALHYHDMGESKNFSYGGIRIPVVWEHSVAEVQDMAEQLREDGAWEREIVKERQGKIDFGKALDEQYDLARQNLANRSVFGPAVQVVRNGRTWKGAASAN